jgi:hypothetical protein
MKFAQRFNIISDDFAKIVFTSSQQDEKTSPAGGASMGGGG